MSTRTQSPAPAKFVLSPLKLSDRLIGRYGEDFLVTNLDHATGIAQLWDITLGKDLISQREDLVELLLSRRLVSAGFPPDREQSIRTFGAFDRRLQYCWAMDDADPRLIIFKSDVEGVIEGVAAEIGGPVPTPEHLLKWWRRWVISDRSDTIFFRQLTH